MASYSRSRPHPWHGLSPGPDPPTELHAYVEITPFDLVKYEIDKASRYLKVDRAQRTSSLPPALYGFIPQTYAGKRVAALMDGAEEGDLWLRAFEDHDASAVFEYASNPRAS